MKYSRKPSELRQENDRVAVPAAAATTWLQAGNQLRAKKITCHRGTLY
jgi:hypothetical protein